jgi:hypothetical protein
MPARQTTWLGRARWSFAGCWKRWQAQYAEALRDLDAAIDLRNHAHDDHPANVTALETRGDVLMLMGDVVGAQRT